MKTKFVRAFSALFCASLCSVFAIAAEPWTTYFPLRVGSYWNYDGKTDDGRNAKVTTIAKEGPIMGHAKTVFFDEDETQFIPGLHHYWYFAATPAGVQLYRYETPYSGNCKPFAPAVNYLPSSANHGAIFVQTHSLSCRNATMQVSRTLRMGNKEVVTVPFGTFNALRIEEDLTYRFASTRKSESEHHVVWLVDGIGEVKRLWRREGNGKATSGELVLTDTNANRPGEAQKQAAERSSQATTTFRLSMERIAAAWVPD